MKTARKWLACALIVAVSVLAMGAKHTGCGIGGHARCHKLERLWSHAGGDSVQPAYLMAAIAMAESGGDAGSVGTDGELGYWQIDPHYWTASADPQANASEAVHVASVQGLDAWTTYRNGDYHGFCGA